MTLLSSVCDSKKAEGRAQQILDRSIGLDRSVAFGKIVHSPSRSSWPAADPEDSSCDENGNANASAGGWGAAPVAQIPDGDLRPRRHLCDTCNAASPDASCDDVGMYLER